MSASKPGPGSTRPTLAPGARPATQRLERRMSGAEAVVRALEAHGVDVVFGIPGTHTLPIDRFVAESPIRHILPRHEQGSGFAADGYARASGRAGVCIVTSGPGVTNLATPAAQAYSDSIPMLIVSPGVPREIYRRGTGFLHEAKDLSLAMDSLVGWSHRAESPGDVVDAIYRAFWEFASCRPRPVHLEVPIDVLDAEAVVSVPPPRAARRPQASAAEVRDALALLAAASRPGLLVGGGAQDAAPEVARLARALDAIVVTTINGKGAFPEDDELAIGAALGSRAGRDALAACDLVLAIGTEVAETDLEDGPLALRGTLIRLDIDPGQLQMNLPADRALQGDAATTARALLAGLGPDRQGDGPARAREARRRADEEVRARARDLTWVMEGMSEVLHQDVIVACDTTQLTYQGVLPARFARQPRSCFNPTGYATLGYALPAAIGAKMARPDRRALAVAGDGGILFTLPELATAVDLGLQLPIVVTNNRGYGEIREGMVARHIDPFGVTFDPPSFTQVAAAFGARGAVAHDATELRGALDTAFQSDGPTLVEAVLSR